LDRVTRQEVFEMKRLMTFAVVCAVLAVPVAGHAGAGAEVVRTVYFSATDANGAPVTDLTAADLSVKENGKARVIASVAPATDPLQVFMLIDDGGSGGFQAAVAQFVQTLFGKAQFAISVLNPQPMRVTDFTGDADALKNAVGGLAQRGRVVTAGDQVPDAIAEAAKALQQRKSARRAIVMMTVGGEQPQSTQADASLNSLKDSGASLNVIYLQGLDLGQVLGDGPKRSGGLIQQVSGGVVLGPVLAKMADTLLHQYVLTYTLPDGTKPSDKLALTTSRKGVTLVAPSRVPEK